ncbi:MAG: hypothetical protein KC620_21250, partial [Myxococcales bacterium]|nr:hypothetical protein [Myxococcales bacterium]
MLVIEGFPFSKRGLAFERLPLLEHARPCQPRPAVVCSLRPRPRQPQPGPALRTEARLTRIAQPRGLPRDATPQTPFATVPCAIPTRRRTGPTARFLRSMAQKSGSTICLPGANAETNGRDRQVAAYEWRSTPFATVSSPRTNGNGPGLDRQLAAKDWQR